MPSSEAMECAAPVLPVREDLHGAARRAGPLAEAHCGSGGGPDCAWYHGSLPVLRALGAVNSPGSDDDFLIPVLASEIEAGARRILLSGSADAGMLARVAAFCRPDRPLDITVLDICRTPLELCRHHAEQFGLRISTVQADILEHEDRAAYDLICTHSFLTFFDTEGRDRLARRWRGLLRPSGAVVTAQRVRSGEAAEVIGYPPRSRQALVATVETLARRLGEDAPVAVDLAMRLAQRYGERYSVFVIASEAMLRRPFERAGFALETCVPPPDSVRRMDLPGAPSDGRDCRWRIVARRAST